MKHHFYIGQRVKNLGIVEATIVGFHHETDELILQDDDGLKWLADPEKCRPIENSRVQKDELVGPGWMHKDGLVVFG